MTAEPLSLFDSQDGDTDLPSGYPSGGVRLPDYLANRYGPALVAGAPSMAAPYPQDVLAGMPTEAAQYGQYSNHLLQTGYDSNLGFVGPGSSATYLLHPDAIDEASTELDRREVEQQMAGQIWTEDSVRRVMEMARNYPAIDSGVLVSMALGGVSDASPEGEFILGEAYDKKMNDDLAGFKGNLVTPEKVMSSEPPAPDIWESNPVGRAVKGAVRGALAVPIGAAQAFSAGLTSAFMEGEGQADAGQTLERLGDEGGGGTLAEILRGATREDEDVQLGSGWIPQQGGAVVQADESGNVGQGQTQMSAGEAATKRIMQYEGRWLSPGRLIPESINATTRDWFDYDIIEPGGKAYNAISWAADTSLQLSSANPGNLVADAPTAVRAARKGFAGSGGAALRQGLIETMGGIRGLRRTVDGDVAKAWLNSKDGTRFVDHVAGETSVTALMRHKGIDLDTANQLRQATDSTQVREILEPLMGTPISMAPTSRGAWRGAGGRVDRMFNRHERVMRRLTPHFGGSGNAGMLRNPGDRNQVYYQMQDHMRNARFTVDEMEGFNRALAELPDQDPLAVERLVRDKFDKTAAKHIEEFSGDQKLAHIATRRFRTRAEMDRMYWSNEIGEARRVPGAQKNVAIDGTVTYSASPHMMSEYLNGAIPMPDATQLRRATAMKGVNWLVNNTEVVPKATDALSRLLGNVWKPMVLLRPAYVGRVIGAEQLRMAASGMDSVFSDPLSYAAWLMGRRGNVLDEAGDRLLSDAAEFKAALNRTSTDRSRGGFMADGHFTAVGLADDEEAYLAGWANELQMVAEDPVAQHLLNHGVDETVEWFWEGAGRSHREALMTNESKRAALTRRALDAEDPDFVDSVEGHIQTTQDIIDSLTGGDSDLLNALRDGKLGDVPMPQQIWDARQRASLRETLRSKAALGTGPPKVRSVRDVSRLKDERRSVVDTMMDGVLTHPTNKLSRSPVFKQSFWNNMARMAPDMDADTLAKLRKMGKSANMDREWFETIDAVKPKPDGRLTDIDAVELLAKHEAIDQVKELLYDPTLRGNFASLTRNIFPFAEAWKEELQVWGRLLADHPLKPAYRLSQSWDFLRESNPLDLDTPSDGRGVFYRNENDEETFAVPVPFFTGGAKAEMRAEGLSMMNFETFLPGLGPVAQIPAGMIINQIPDSQLWLRDTLMDIALPFGGPEFTGESLPGELLDRSMPAWARAAYEAFTADVNDPDRNQKFADMVTKTMQARLMSGEATMPRDPGDVKRLMDESARDARGLWIIKALGKAVMPSSPEIQFEMRDDNERLWTANTLKDYYFALNKQYGEQGAVAQMMQQFGAGGLGAVMLSQSQEVRPHGLNESDWNWKRQHQDFYATHPNAAYHFTTSKGEGEFSFDGYADALNSGARIKLPLLDRVNRMQDSVGSIIYRSAQARAEQMFGSTDSEDARMWLRQQQIDIKRSLYGYGTESGFKAMDPEEELAAVAHALPDAPDTDLADAVEELILAHDEANTFAAASGYANYYQAQDMAPVRDFMQSKLEEIVGVTPDAVSVADLIRSLIRRGSESDASTNTLIAWRDKQTDLGFSGMMGPMAGITGGPSPMAAGDSRMAPMPTGPQPLSLSGTGNAERLTLRG